jgi:hypothetical protein
VVDILSTSQEGQVFLLPFNDQYVLAQVGRGGDLGVYNRLYNQEGEFDPLHLASRPAFRVHFGQSSIKKYRWVPLGCYALEGCMGQPAPYVHQAVGSDRCFIVKHECEDQEVECDAVRDLERLAIWQHLHIVERIKGLRASEDGAGRHP